MNTLEAIAERKSIRAYKEDQISEEDIQKILKAGMAAPVSSGAYDTVHLTVIQDKKLISDIGEAVNEMVLKMLGRKMDKRFGEPLMIMVSAQPAHMPGIEMANAGCILENMAIAATDLGIDNIIWGGASAVVGQNEELMKRVQIPEGYKPVLCASFGYAAVRESAKVHQIFVNRV